MVLQVVEVSQITKHSKFFRTYDQLNLLCVVRCKMVLFMFKFPCSNSLVAGVRMVLKVIWIPTK